MLAAAPGPRMRLVGLAGAWEVHGLDGQEAALRDGARPGDPGFGEVPEAAWGRSRTARAARAGAERAAATTPAFYAGVAARAARRRARRRWTPTTPSLVLEVIDAARADAAEGS